MHKNISGKYSAGTKFNQLTVVSYYKNSKYWFKCKCGNVKLLGLSNVISGATKTCGDRNKHPLINHCIGKAIGIFNKYSLLKKQIPKTYLIPLGYTRKGKSEQRFGKFKCICGKIKFIRLGDIFYRKKIFTKSCGCKNNLSCYSIGEKLGNFTLIKKVYRKGWLIRCSCGNTRIIATTFIGNSKYAQKTCGVVKNHPEILQQKLPDNAPCNRCGSARFRYRGKLRCHLCMARKSMEKYYRQTNSSKHLFLNNINYISQVISKIKYLPEFGGTLHV